MTAPRPAEERDKPRRLALDEPLDLAWGARLIQVALERRRRRLASSKRGKRDAG